MANRIGYGERSASEASYWSWVFEWVSAPFNDIYPRTVGILAKPGLPSSRITQEIFGLAISPWLTIYSFAQFKASPLGTSLWS
jgi:hypothetical protein